MPCLTCQAHALSSPVIRAQRTTQRQGSTHQFSTLRCRSSPADRLVVKASSDDLPDLDAQLKEDMARLRERQGSAGMPTNAPLYNSTPDSFSRRIASEPGPSTPLESAKEAVDKLLIADFFFVLFALGWLGVGLAAKSIAGSSALLDLWLQLWQWVFQPAIGVLMLGALTSGAVGWARDNLGGGSK